MTRYNKRFFEMLVRVKVFRGAHQDVIGKGSNVDQLLEVVEKALGRIADHSTRQTSGRNVFRISTSNRVEARDELRRQLEALTRTANSMGLKQFFMPRDRSDRSIANVGRLFVGMAEPLAGEFLANHLPADFIDRLKSGIETIENSIQEQAAAKGARQVATTVISEAQAEAAAALTRLDPIMDNMLRSNEPVRTAWIAARHIEKAPVSRRAAGRAAAGGASVPAAASAIPA